MPLTRSLTELRADVLQYADMVGSSFVTTTELDRRINESNRRLHGLLAASAIAHQVLAKQLAAVTVADVADVNLPIDFYKLVTLDVKAGSLFEAAEPLQWHRRNDFQESSGWTEGSKVYYTIISTSGGSPFVRWYPTPQAVHDITVSYIPHPPVLTALDTVSYPNGWESWIAIDVAIQLQAKEETDSSQLLLERERIESEITSAVASMERSGPERVRDTRGRFRGRENLEPWSRRWGF